MSIIAANLQHIQRRIIAAECAAGRPRKTVRLVAVSKGFPAAAVVDAIDSGQLDFGENYLQEALGKIAEVAAARPDSGALWHFIGPIQSNKTRAIAENFDWVHSVDRLKVGERLSEQRPSILPPLKILIQVNISGETTKSGVAAAQAEKLAEQLSVLPGLSFRGLMALPAPSEDAAESHSAFSALRRLGEGVGGCGELSMGMSDDFEAAIAEGATIVRIGTAIFGKRSSPEEA